MPGVNDAVSLRHSVEDFENSLRNNLVQVFSLTHYCLEALIASKGVVINIGSKCSVTGQGGTSGYAASKGGMNALTREWALDLAKYCIRVNCVIPAEVITPLCEAWLAKASDPEEARRQLNATIPLGTRTTTIEEIADTVAFVPRIPRARSCMSMVATFTWIVLAPWTPVTLNPRDSLRDGQGPAWSA